MGTPRPAQRNRFWVDWSSLRSPIPVPEAYASAFRGREKTWCLVRVDRRLGCQTGMLEVAENQSFARKSGMEGYEGRELFARRLQSLPDVAYREV